MPPGDGLHRVVRVLSSGLVYAGAAVAVVLTVATVTVDRAGGTPIDPAATPGIVLTLVFAGLLPLALWVRKLDELRRYFVACVVATLLVFVTRPEGIIGGSVALVGAAIGVLRSL